MSAYYRMNGTGDTLIFDIKLEDLPPPEQDGSTLEIIFYWLPERYVTWVDFQAQTPYMIPACGTDHSLPRCECVGGVEQGVK